MKKSFWEKGFFSKRSSSDSYYEFGMNLASISSFVLVVPIALVSLLFLFKISLSPVTFISGIILGLFISFYFAQDKKSFVLALIVFSSVVLISGLFLSNTVDLSHDSLSYHTRAINDIAQGFNPVYDSHEILWVQHYPQGMWAFQAGINQLIPANMQVTSVVNFIALSIAFSASFTFFSKIKHFSLPLRSFFVFASVFATIPLSQVMSHMIDGFFGSLAIAATWILAGFMFNVFKRDDIRALGLFGSILMLLTLNKFTGFVFACMLLGVYLVYLLLFERNSGELRRYFIFCGVLLAALIVIGFSPYVKNTVMHANPFYPLLSSDLNTVPDAPDKTQRPGAYKEVNPISGLFMSITEPVKGISESKYWDPKLPFVVSSSEIASLGGVDVAIGGNGPLFMLSLLMGVSAYIWYLFRQDVSPNIKLRSLVLIAGFFIASLSMIETWWTRLVPFFSFFPVLLLFIFTTRKLNKAQLAYAALCALVIVLNTGLVFITVFGETQARIETRASLESYFDTKQPNHFRFDPDTEEQVKEGLRRTLRELGLNAEEHPSLIPSDGMIFVDDQTGEQFQRFIFEDDPPNDSPHPDTTWEHVTPAQSLFIRR